MSLRALTVSVFSVPSPNIVNLTRPSVRVVAAVRAGIAVLVRQASTVCLTCETSS
ncbi:hypothetical protein D3C81_1218490 [compost metagenome]